MKSSQTQQGFTLIELVVVIVILGILAATALPRFVDLSGDAVNAKAQGVAGAIASGAAIEYARLKVAGTTLSLATACSSSVLQGMPGTCSASPGANTCSGSGGVGTCVVSCTEAGASKTATVTVACDTTS